MPSTAHILQQRFTLYSRGCFPTGIEWKQMIVPKEALTSNAAEWQLCANIIEKIIRHDEHFRR
jgi:hypothetical protein